MTNRTGSQFSAEGGLDNDRTRRLNDELRKLGRGGVVTVSLGLVAAGEETVVQALRAVAKAQARPTATYGTVLTGIGELRWKVDEAADGARLLIVWSASEEEVAGSAARKLN